MAIIYPDEIERALDYLGIEDATERERCDAEITACIVRFEYELGVQKQPSGANVMDKLDKLQSLSQRLSAELATLDFQSEDALLEAASLAKAEPSEGPLANHKLALARSRLLKATASVKQLANWTKTAPRPQEERNPRGRPREEAKFNLVRCMAPIFEQATGQAATRHDGGWQRDLSSDGNTTVRAPSPFEELLDIIAMPICEAAGVDPSMRDAIDKHRRGQSEKS